MTPTFTLPSSSTGNPFAGSTSNLLPGEAVEPVAGFATEMKLYRALPVTPPESGEWLPTTVAAEAGEMIIDGAEILARGGELLPADGNDLPANLRIMLDELRGLALPDAALVTSPGTLEDVAPTSATDLQPGIDLNTEFPVYAEAEINLPPGLELETSLTSLPPTLVPLNVGEFARGNAASTPSQSPQNDIETAVGLASTQPAAERQALIQQLSQLANVSADKLEAIAERRDISTADLKRITEFLAQNQQVADRAIVAASRTDTLSVSTTAVPVPAPMARIDGTILDGKSQRFRPLGVGQPQLSAETRVSPTVVELEVDVPELQRASQPRADVIASEVLRQESLQNPKPTFGSSQIAAPQPGQGSVSSSQPFQPLDTGSKPLPGSIDVPVRDAAWGERLGDRVVMMANNRLQNVDLRLSPAEMGPLRVKVSVEDGTANVTFVTQHAVTREAIEQALPRLKTMLEQNGIELGNTSVDQQAPDQGTAHADANAGGDGSDSPGQDARASASERVEAGVMSDPRQSVRLSRGLLDTFA